jgi:hypothetical protein
MTQYEIPFKSVDGRDCLVEVSLPNYSVIPIRLTGTDNPFTTSLDDSDDLFSPVRRSTGYIRILDTGTCPDIIPTSPKLRGVRLTVDGTLMWQGWLKPETYKAQWDYLPTLEIPVVSGLGVLDSLPLLQEDVTLSTGQTMPVAYGSVRIARLILEAIHLMGTNITRVEFPNSVRTSDGWGAMGYRLSRYNYFHANNDTDHSAQDWKPIVSVSALEMLEDICTFFGWTAIEHKTALLFVEAGCTDYVTADINDFASYALELSTPDLAAVQLQSLTLDDYTLAGARNTVEHLQGARKVTVEANSADVSDIISIGEKDLEIVSYQFSVLFTRSVFFKALKSNTPLIEIHGYTTANGGTTWQETDITAANCMTTAGAVVAAYDNRNIDEENMNEDTGLFLKKTAVVGSSSYAPSEAQSLNMPAVVIKAPGKAACWSTGYLCISATAESCKADFSDHSGTLNGKGWVKAMLQCGNLYYGDDGWGTTPRYFKFQIKKSDDTDGTDGDGAIVNQKRTRIDCESCSGWLLRLETVDEHGYIHPLSPLPDGDVVLTIPTLVQTETDGGNGDYDDLILRDFRIEYKAPISRYYLDDSTRRYSVFTGIEGEDVRVSTNIASADRTRPGYGILRDGSKEDVTAMTYANGVTERPEVHLVGRMANHYASTREKLIVDVDIFGQVPNSDSPDCSVSYDGKTFAIIGREVNWRDWTQTLTLLEI